MSEIKNPNPNVPASKVVAKPPARFSIIWLIPLVAALAGLWVAINTIRNEGPKITITFKSADGLDANKTKIRYNGVEVGELSAIRLSDDYQSVIATAKMSPKTEQFLRKDTKFWVVRPQISGANVSGLSTIISGAYIGMEIGKSKDSERHYEALPNAPLETGGVTGRFFTLKTPQLGSLGKGTPIYYRRLQAGQVSNYELDPSGKFLNVTVFVQAPYDQYVTGDTRFWQASGIDLSLTANGLRVQTESVLSILVGGIAFETPVTDTPLPPAGADATFTLAKDREQAFRPPAQNPQKFKFVFTESLRGLTVGAPVEINGITIGEVLEIHAQFDAGLGEFTAPVTVQVDPARYGVDFLNAPVTGTAEDIASHRKALDTFVARGLRAQLKTGSFISGSRFVALDFFPDAPPVTLDWTQTPVQLPTLPGSMESIEAGVVGVIKKLERLPLAELGTNLNKTVANLDKTLVGAQGTLTNADLLLKNASGFIAPDSAFDAQLNAMLQQVGGAAQAMRVLADYLERHPEALLRGKSGSAK
jgi:paraquat-inducible protein B